VKSLCVAPGNPSTRYKLLLETKFGVKFIHFWGTINLMRSRKCRAISFYRSDDESAHTMLPNVHVHDMSRYKYIMGNGHRPSFLDLTLLNRHYQCGGRLYENGNGFFCRQRENDFGCEAYISRLSIDGHVKFMLNM
jgi:hypothetical protein